MRLLVYTVINRCLLSFRKYQVVAFVGFHFFESFSSIGKSTIVEFSSYYFDLRLFLEFPLRPAGGSLSRRRLSVHLKDSDLALRNVIYIAPVFELQADRKCFVSCRCESRSFAFNAFGDTCQRHECMSRPQAIVKLQSTVKIG